MKKLKKTGEITPCMLHKMSKKYKAKVNKPTMLKYRK
jgi:hypothetical protein